MQNQVTWRLRLKLENEKDFRPSNSQACIAEVKLETLINFGASTRKASCAIER